MITRIIFTLFIYGVYRCLNLINISYQDVSWDSFLVYLNSGKVTSIAFLDFEPALAGFFVVEVLFMLIPPLRKIRKSGRKGRKVITKWALIASLGFALMEAIPHVKKMGSYVYPDGTAMLSSTSLLAQAAYVSFFVGGFALILFLAKLISKYGVGNGFASLIGLAIIENLCFSLKEYILDIVILGYYIHILGFFILAGVAWQLYRLMSKKDITLIVADEKILNVKVPFFQSGAVATIVIAQLFLTLAPKLNTFLPGAFNVQLFNLIYQNDTVTIMFFGIFLFISLVLCQWFFSRPTHIAHDLSIDKYTVENRYNAVVKSSVTFLVLIMLFYVTWPMSDKKVIPDIIDVKNLLLFMAIFLDWKGQFKFLKQSQPAVDIAEMDNVHFASVLRQKLNEHHIPHYIQNFQFRRLYFFLAPLYKMKLVVAKDKEDKAKEIFNHLKPAFV